MTGILNKTRCYLIGNLEHNNFGVAQRWRDEFSAAVRPMGIITMSPLDKVFKNFQQENEQFKQKMLSLLKEKDMETVHKEMQRIRRRDLAMVDHSTFLVGVLDTTTPTYGTVEELSFATRARKPIFLVIQQGISKLPLWIASMMNPDCFYDSLFDVVIKLERINNGTELITDDKWRIFEDKYNTIS